MARIVVIDDSKFMRNLFRHILEQGGTTWRSGKR